ncbi:MAG: hypothetical protein LC749_06485, partial [Actinobacteria bacterium]|nr:hypothetical protein [Actinomycetota bacterium]
SPGGDRQSGRAVPDLRRARRSPAAMRSPETDGTQATQAEARGCGQACPIATGPTQDPAWHRAASRARLLSWLSLAYMTAEGAGMYFPARSGADAGTRTPNLPLTRLPLHGDHGGYQRLHWLQ